ncbi:MAG: autoinducer binding domain-containing protein [Jannaschia sp.]
MTRDLQNVLDTWPEADAPTGAISVVSQVMAADTIDAAWDVFVPAMLDRSFVRMIYGQSRFHATHSGWDRRNSIILHHGPQAFFDAYIDGELFIHNPIFHWVRDRTGFATWEEARQAFQGPMTPELAQILKLQAEYGGEAGFTGGLGHLVPGLAGGLGLNCRPGITASDADIIWSRHGAEIEMISHALHLRVASLPRSGATQQLSTRQRECLQWAAQGKRARDIALIMEVSAATVEKHLRLARDALDCDTTVQAVHEALSRNLLML